VNDDAAGRIRRSLAGLDTTPPPTRRPMRLTFAHAAVPDHIVSIDVSDRLWIAAQCSCGKDFSRRKWVKAARYVIEDADQHLRAFAPSEEPYDEWEFLPGEGRFK
jgi:hypothetical protein